MVQSPPGAAAFNAYSKYISTAEDVERSYFSSFLLSIFLFALFSL